MEKQIIISICREYGSAGHEIAEALSQKLNLPLYDKNFFEELAKAKNVDSANLAKYDEIPRKFFVSRTVKGYSSSPEQNVAEMQFELLKSIAQKGDSFIVVGRCSDEIFKDYQNAVSIFITADENDKIAHLIDKFGLSSRQAKKEMSKYDKRRKFYHDYFCANNWGECKSYDLSINASCLGTEKTVDFLYQFIKQKFDL